MPSKARKLTASSRVIGGMVTEVKTAVNQLATEVHATLLVWLVGVYYTPIARNTQARGPAEVRQGA